jgi:TIR domain-containing protein
MFGTYTAIGHLADFDLSDEVKEILRCASIMATGANQRPPMVTTSCLLFAIAETGRVESKLFGTPQFLWKELNSDGEKAYRNAFTLKFPSQYNFETILDSKHITYTFTLKKAEFMTGNVRGVFQLASEISSKTLQKLPAETTGQAGGSSMVGTSQINVQHLLAALLVFQPKSKYVNTEVTTHLSKILTDAPSLRERFFDFIVEFLPSDSHKVWREILLLKKEVKVAKLAKQVSVESHEVMEGLKVFLCHGKEDKAAVRELYTLLQEEGMQPWLDEEDIEPGALWDIAIQDAVRDCHIVLVCLSHTSVKKDGYIQKEIKYALDKADEKPEGTTYIIPAKLEDCDVPRRLSQWQWVNLYDKGGYERLLVVLKKHAVRHASRKNVPPPD